MNINLTHAEILSVRDASRRMVRGLGFMRTTLADTDLSPSAVHTIIEIGNRGRITANQLAQTLFLEKSSISRMLARLVERGLITEEAIAADGRSKNLSLTGKGRELLADIDRFANLQVGRALHALTSEARQQVVAGLSAYANALRAAHGEELEQAEVTIEAGYKPGALGWIAGMHGQYYTREWNFPPSFEAKVAAGLADFVPRLGNPANEMWLAMQNGQIKGSIAIDGEDLGDGKAHLRWVIVDDDVRGSGAGRRLVKEAVEFCDRQGFAEIHLWTFSELRPAIRLYQMFGFELAEEWVGTQWGMELPEQRYVRRR